MINSRPNVWGDTTPAAGESSPPISLMPYVFLKPIRLTIESHTNTRESPGMTEVQAT